MGQYADDLIDAIMDDPGAYYFSARKFRKPKIPTCNKCGQFNLIWQFVENRWVLYEMASTNIYDLVPHNCSLKNRFKNVVTQK